MEPSRKPIVVGIALALMIEAFAATAAAQSGRGNPGEHHVTLSWQPPVNAKSEKVVGYNVYRSAQPGGPDTIQASRVPTPTYVDKNVESGKTYYYVITSIDESGRESRQSQEIRATVP